jgi:hypothetical protein
MNPTFPTIQRLVAVAVWTFATCAVGAAAIMVAHWSTPITTVHAPTAEPTTDDVEILGNALTESPVEPSLVEEEPLKDLPLDDELPFFDLDDADRFIDLHLDDFSYSVRDGPRILPLPQGPLSDDFQHYAAPKDSRQ